MLFKKFDKKQLTGRFIFFLTIIGIEIGAISLWGTRVEISESFFGVHAFFMGQRAINIILITSLVLILFFLYQAVNWKYVNDNTISRSHVFELRRLSTLIENLRDENNTLKGKVSEMETGLNQKEVELAELHDQFIGVSFLEKFDRFECITKKVNVGIVDFFPTIEIRSGRIHGLGKDIIDYIFNGNVSYLTDLPLTWANMTTSLSDGKCDILATPVYDTPNRRLSCEFSMPIYYANMGIYVRSKSPVFLNVESESMSFLDLKYFIEESEIGLSTLVNDGEINELVLKQHFPNVELEYDSESYEVNIALSQLASTSSNREIVICERFIAKEHEEFKKGNIKNILGERQLLYPVVIMMRKGEQALRKYVNLRLMSMFDSQEYGDIFGKNLERVGADPSIDDVKSNLFLSYFYRGLNSEDLVMSLRENINHDDKVTKSKVIDFNSKKSS